MPVGTISLRKVAEQQAVAKALEEERLAKTEPKKEVGGREWGRGGEQAVAQGLVEERLAKTEGGTGGRARRQAVGGGKGVQWRGWVDRRSSGGGSKRGADGRGSTHKIGISELEVKHPH